MCFFLKCTSRECFYLSDYDPPVDLALLVDSSSAVNWSKMQDLLKGYVSTWNISYTNNHVAIVSFASSSNIDRPFPSSNSPEYTKELIWQEIDDLKPQGGDDRRIDYGLENVTELFGSEYGARRDARQVKATVTNAKANKIAVYVGSATFSLS